MNRIAIIFMILLSSGFYLNALAGDNNKKTSEAAINWITIEEAEKAMTQKPKKLLIDVYTSWCGWCKVMDKKTYENPEVIKYINATYYAVKLDAEQKSPVTFQGKTYNFNPEQRANELAVQLLQGRLSYPTTIFMMENFQNAIPIPGYLDVDKMEMLSRYVGDNLSETVPWKTYEANFQPTWSKK